MRKSITYIATLFVAVAAAVSCDKSDGMTPIESYEAINGTPISVAVEGSRAVENSATDLVADGFYLYIDQDSDITTTDGSGDLFVFMKRDDTNGWVAYTDSTAATPSTDFVWVDFKRATVTALYAMEGEDVVASVAVADMLSLSCSVPADQSSAMQYADWLVASSLREGAVSKSDATGQLTLNFDHLYSRLTIKVMKDGTTLSSVKSCAVVEVEQEATLCLQESTTAFEYAANVAAGLTLYPNAAETTYEAIVLPQTFAEGVSIAINTYDEIFVYTTLTDLDGASDGAQLEMVGGGDYIIEVPVPASFFSL